MSPQRTITGSIISFFQFLPGARGLTLTKGSVLNGANLRAVWDTAPTGQKRFSLKTQGGAGACPGLWDSAPLGLKLDVLSVVNSFFADFIPIFLSGFIA
jgi:hypothetical protein